MSSLKRLFLFAGFDRDNIIDDTVVYYIKALSVLGDVVFVTDNELSDEETKKISNIPNVLHIYASKHGEYDFGSYKRGFLWALNKNVLKNYDWVYFVNDSVYGPLYDIDPILKNLEKSGSDLVGMTESYDDNTPSHVQSWFIGFSKKVFTQKFFKDFIEKISRIPNKTSLIMKYEVGLSHTIMRHGFKSSVLVNAKDNTIYENPRFILTKGLPFVKKSAISNLRRIYFLYPYVEREELLDFITAHMKRHNITMVKNSFRDVYKLHLFGIQLLRISAKRSKYYKVYLFKYIPILKIVK